MNDHNENQDDATKLNATAIWLCVVAVALSSGSIGAAVILYATTQTHMPIAPEAEPHRIIAMPSVTDLNIPKPAELSQIELDSQDIVSALEGHPEWNQFLGNPNFTRVELVKSRMSGYSDEERVAIAKMASDFVGAIAEQEMNNWIHLGDVSEGRTSMLMVVKPTDLMRQSWYMTERLRNCAYRAMRVSQEDTPFNRRVAQTEWIASEVSFCRIMSQWTEAYRLMFDRDVAFSVDVAQFDF